MEAAKARAAAKARFDAIKNKLKKNIEGLLRLLVFVAVYDLICVFKTSLLDDCR